MLSPPVCRLVLSSGYVNLLICGAAGGATFAGTVVRLGWRGGVWLGHLRDQIAALSAAFKSFEEFRIRSAAFRASSVRPGSGE